MAEAAQQWRPPDPALPGMAELIAAFNWAQTPLGPRSRWPAELQTTVNIMLDSALPMVTLWGQAGVLIYNDGYAEICGARHPAALGVEALKAWPEVASLNQRVLDVCLAGGTLSLRDEHLVLYRNGFAEEVWLDVDYSPVREPDGRCGGVLAILSDVTTRKEAERRQACLIELGDRMRRAETSYDIGLTAAEIIGRALNCARAGYAVIKGDHAYVEVDWTDGEAVSTQGARPFSALGEAFCAPLRAGRPLVIDDTETHPAAQHNLAAFRRVKIGSLVNIPLLENGVIAALAYAQHKTSHHWNAHEVQLVKDVADRTWEASSRVRAAQALRKLNASLEHEIALRTAQRDRMWRLSSDVMLVTDPQGVIQSGNPAWTTLFGWSETELVGANILDLAPPEDRAAKRAVLLENGAMPVKKFECRTRRRDGAYLWLSWRAVASEDGLLMVGRDITQEREQAEALKTAEEALRQAQKMEAVGQLTGGIAHDFNNLLQGITGSLDLVEKRLGEGRIEEVRRFTAAARGSANRAVALTHRLLAFSRRQPLDPKPLRVNPLAAAMEDLLRRTMGERIEIVLDLAPDLWATRCDPNQLESALLNLAINARDAMPEGGRLTLSTRNEVLDAAAAARFAEAQAGEYVHIAVTDTGTGMPPSVVEQAFEPFFTTKPLGQGTGLGLSMIYGFARQSGGFPNIRSELGTGTTVALYLPRFEGAFEEDAAPMRAPEATPRPAAATALVVEDEELVRSLVCEVVEELGLTVLQAADGPTGLEFLRSRQKIDLLITDIGLPGLNGRQMADAARMLRPGLRILFMTGYAESAAGADGFLEPGMAMITKPFPIDNLATRVREMLAE